MERLEVVDKISEFVKETMMGRVSDIKPDDSLAEDIGVDSMGRVELITMIEDEYGMLIEDDDVSSMITVNDVVDYVLKHVE